MNTLRTLLVALLVVGGVARITSTDAPKRVVLPAPAHSGVCSLGTSC